jgi:parvulin-like peptidyl-prolyl isomerase
MRRLSVPVLLLSVLGGAASARGETVERVVAKVNGQIITLSEFQGRQIEAARAAGVDASTVAAFLRQHNARILQNAIDEILLMQKAEDAGMTPPEQYVDQVIEQIKKEHDISTEEEYEAALAREGLTPAELRQSLERRVLREMILRRDVEPKMTVSDAELRAAYEQARDTEFTTPGKTALQEIVVENEAGGEALARQLAAKARAGEDFAALALAHSAAPSRAHGGEIGEVADGDMAADLREVALALPVGGVSPPLRTEGGYRIIKVTGRKAAATQPFEEVRQRLYDRAMAALFEREYEIYLEELRKNAQIELRVREVPLQITGQIPEGSLLGDFDTGIAPPDPSSAAPEPQPPTPAIPTGIGADEIEMTPQAAPERVAPAGATAPSPPASPAPGEPKAAQPEANAPGR